MADVLLLCSSCSNLLSTCQLQEVAVNEKRIYTIAASFGYVVNGKVHILAACSIIVCVAVVQHVCVGNFYCFGFGYLGINTSLCMCTVILF